MGLTMGCARCHDHKFDPISQKDYYRFFAFFNTIAEKGLDGEAATPHPFWKCPPPRRRARWRGCSRRSPSTRPRCRRKRRKPLLAAWQKTRLDHTAGAAAPMDCSREYDLRRQPRRLIRQPSRRQASRAHAFTAGRPGQSAAFNGEAQVEFPGFQADRFAIAFWMRSGALGEMTVLEGGPGFDIGVEDSHPQPNEKRGSPLYVEYQGRRWHSDAIVFGGQWHHVALNFEDGSPALLLDGKPVRMERCRRKAGAIPAGPLTIGDPHRDKPLKGDVGGLRIYTRALTAADAEALALHEPIRSILAQEESKRTKDQNAASPRLLPAHTNARRLAARLRRAQ